MKKILILGDCIATGQNCLLNEITGIDPLYIEDDFQRMDEQRKKFVAAWFIKNNKNQINLQKLNRNEIIDLAVKEKIKCEKKISWPNFMNADTENLSVAGETFQGMHDKIKTYIKNKGYPTQIILTDFDDTHCCVIINHLGTKYIVKRPIALIHEPQSWYPTHVYEKFKKVAEKEILQGKKTFLKRSKKSLYFLKKFIEKTKINYNIVSFQPWLREIEKNFIDCNHFVNIYKNGKTIDIKKKRDSQPLIANYVCKKLKI